MKVLFLDTVHPILRERLEGAQFICSEEYHLTREDLLQEVAKYDGIVIRSKFTLDREFFDKAINLKFVARSGSGLENINHPYAKSKNIAVFNAPEGNRMAVAEHVVGMLLSLFNHLIRGDHEVRQGQWLREKNRGTELNSKTVGIIGFGNNGSALGEVLSGFGCRILAYDKYKSNFGHSRIEEVDLKTIQEEADIISFHVPLTSETKFMFNKDFLKECAKSIFLVNSSRGKIADTQTVVSGLKSGKILGACLDVLEYEKSSFEALGINQFPEPFQYLIQSQKVIFSPHVAGWTTESYIKLSEVLADKILEEFA